MRVFSGLAILAIAFMLSGCADQAGVSNSTNSFSYGGQAANKDKTETYTWKNTMGGAQISWGGQLAKGSLSLTISDSAGKQVYSETMSGSSQGGFSGSTSSGAPGDWKIKITFKDYTGQMGLSIQASAGGGSGFGF